MGQRFLLLFPVAILIVLLSVYASGKDGTNRPGETNYQAALRMIGHKLLLSAGDTHSRVLPIREMAGNQFQIHFEHPLSLEPDSIFKIISRTAKLSSLPDDYTADILECADHGIVYSFKMSNVDSNVIVPCAGRTLPRGCYYVNISFARERSVFRQVFIPVVSIVLLVLSIYLLRLYFRGRQNKVLTVNVGTTNPAYETVKVGEFLFYADQRYLEINGEKIELTDKESKLLSILAAAPNVIIDREQLQKNVWENEGVIVTRSLDVFISRLRKKLEKDPSVKIANVHGKGYKLEVPA